MPVSSRSVARSTGPSSTVGEGAAFASERAAEQLRQAQERMRDALLPPDVDDETDPAGPGAS